MEKILESTNGVGSVDEAERQEPQIEELDFFTLQFMKEHIDMPEIVDFDPSAELKEIEEFIATLPKENQSAQRSVLVSDFKRRLKIYRENMAQAQLDLKRTLRENADAGLDELESMVTKIITENGVSSQVEYFDQAVVSYFYAHEDIASTIRTYKTRYPNNWEVGLFTDLFGQAPKGKIEIEEMPLSVYVKIQNIEDYVFAHIGDSKNESLVNTTRHSGGAALIAREFKKVPKLSKKVVIENTSMVTEEYSKESIKPHEEEHMIHKNMYPRSSFIRWERKWPIKLGKNQEIQFSVFKTIIDDSIHNILVQDWEYSTKTEILAYMKDSSDIDYIKNCLTNPNGLYNYLVDRRDYYLNWFLDHIKKSGSNISSPNHRSLTEDEIKQIYSEALDEAWYKKFLPILERTLNTVKKMFEQYGQDKYPEIMRLLAQEPIDKWPRLARILS